jgi:hypothetical protein
MIAVFLFAIRFKPAANINLRVTLTAVVARAFGVRRFLVPLEDVELQIATVDHDPSARIVTLQSANLTSINRIDHRDPQIVFSNKP